MEHIQVKPGNLSSEINHLRQLMISTAKAHGLGSRETLMYSQELDKLIIQVQLQNR